MNAALLNGPREYLFDDSDYEKMQKIYIHLRVFKSHVSFEYRLNRNKIFRYIQKC